MSKYLLVAVVLFIVFAQAGCRKKKQDDPYEKLITDPKQKELYKKAKAEVLQDLKLPAPKPNEKYPKKNRCINLKPPKNAPKEEQKRTKATCEAIWNKFAKGFTTGAWDDLFKDVKFTTKPNSALFWSGTLPIAHDAEVKNAISPKGILTTLEDTMGGRMFNNLPESEAWPNKLRYADGQGKATLPNTAEFWRRASENFALSAKGQVTVLLGSQTPFRKGSIFEMTEFGRLLDMLSEKQIDGIRIIIVPPPYDKTTSIVDQYVDSIEDLKAKGWVGDGKVKVEFASHELQTAIKKYCAKLPETNNDPWCVNSAPTSSACANIADWNGLATCVNNPNRLQMYLERYRAKKYKKDVKKLFSEWKAKLTKSKSG